MRKFSPLAEPRVSKSLMGGITILSLLIGMVHVITPAGAKIYISRNAFLGTSAQAPSGSKSDTDLIVDEKHYNDLNISNDRAVSV